MRIRNEVYKNGVLISVTDTRVLLEVQEQRKAELRKSLTKYLKLTDWEVIRSADPTSGIPIKDETILLRKKARNLARNLESELDAATHLDDLERFNPNIEDLV
tara:strand:+ start:22373 stop:22681 length:309 start_codon:yes stop_codon:yes gene_type:complete